MHLTQRILAAGLWSHERLRNGSASETLLRSQFKSRVPWVWHSQNLTSLSEHISCTCSIEFLQYSPVYENCDVHARSVTVLVSSPLYRAIITFIDHE